MSVMQSLLNLLRDRVAKKAVSVAELAAACDCSREYVYKVLRGDSQPTLPMAEKFASALGAEFTLKVRDRRKTSA